MPVHEQTCKESLVSSEMDHEVYKGSVNLNLTFKRGDDFKIRGYCDSDYASDLDRSRSITGYIYTIGGNTESWSSSLQEVVALSTTEA